MRADLHMHSIYSDGTKSIKEIVDLAKKNNVDMIAITDHDSVDVIKEDIRKYDLKIIIGTEFSTMYKGENVHLLGYYKKNKPSEILIKYLKDLSKERQDRAKEMLARLKKYFDIELDYEELKSISDGNIGRPHIAKLIQKKYGIGVETVFNKMLGNDSPCFIPSSTQDLKSTIDFLKQNNVITVLAHPICYKNTSIEEFIGLGIDGIECYYPEHKKKYSKKLVKYCNLNNLLITGGSDFHDDDIYKLSKHGSIGDSCIEEDDIKVLLERLEV